MRHLVYVRGIYRERHKPRERAITELPEPNEKLAEFKSRRSFHTRTECSEARLSERRGTNQATQFLRELKEERHVFDAEFLVDGLGYLTALARTDPDGELNYTDRTVVEKLFQTYTMRIGWFHVSWNGGQRSAQRWLTAYTFYYNHLRGH